MQYYDQQQSTLSQPSPFQGAGKGGGMAPEIPQGFNKRQDGFTLLEVLVALAIIAIALGTLLQISANSINRVSTLQEGLIAQWIAENRATEIRINKPLLHIGSSIGRTRMAERDFEWTSNIIATPDPSVYQIQIFVVLASAPKHHLAQFTTYAFKQ